MRTQLFSPTVCSPKISPAWGTSLLATSSAKVVLQSSNGDTFTPAVSKAENRSGLNTAIDLARIQLQLLPALKMFTSDAIIKVFRMGEFEGRIWHACELAHDTNFNPLFLDAGRLVILKPFDQSGTFKILSIPNVDNNAKTIVSFGSIEQRDDTVEQLQQITLHNFELERLFSLTDKTSIYSRAYNPYILKKYRTSMIQAKADPLTSNPKDSYQASYILQQIQEIVENVFSKDRRREGY